MAELVEVLRYNFRPKNRTHMYVVGRAEKRTGKGYTKVYLVDGLAPNEKGKDNIVDLESYLFLFVECTELGPSPLFMLCKV